MAARKKRQAKKKAARRTVRSNPGPFDEIQHPDQRAFLSAFATCASIGRSAEAAGVSRASHYVWKKDPAYADAFKLAEELAGDALEDEAVRRAHEGIEEPIVHHGRIMGLWILPDGRQLPGHTGEEPPHDDATFQPITVNKRSDGLLRALLEGFKGSKYATQRHQVSGGGGAPMGGFGVLLVPTGPETLEEWKKQHGAPTENTE